MFCNNSLTLYIDLWFESGSFVDDHRFFHDHVFLLEVFPIGVKKTESSLHSFDVLPSHAKLVILDKEAYFDSSIDCIFFSTLFALFLLVVTILVDSLYFRFFR